MNDTGPEPAGPQEPSPTEESVFAKAGRADVARIRHKTLRRRLVVALGVVLAMNAYIVSRGIRGRSLLPELPDGWQFWLPQFILVVVLLGLGMVMVLPLLSGRSPDRVVRPEEIEVGLDQVVGLEGQVDEVMRTLDVFLAYKTFREQLGGNPRRGVLFEGPPGTGKTYLAKAMAKQAGVPFLFASSSEFQNVYFGMTNVRIRRFFKKLRKAARREGGAIGFIEEIDTIGENRGGVAMSPATGLGPRVSSAFMNNSGASGIVNELLVQMQSFDEPSRSQRFVAKLVGWMNDYLPEEWRIKFGRPAYHNVLIIAATNRASALDPALLRPGRFDRRIFFDAPSKSARRELVDFFLERKAHAAELDEDHARDRIAHDTLGYTPAMIENLFDEALVVGLRHDRDAMVVADLYEAKLGQELGLKQPVGYTEQERRVIATHEAGHATVAHLLGTTQRLEVLSIIKRQGALGLLARADMEERFTRTRSELESAVAISLAGMCAEELYFGESSTGPGGDLTHATGLVATMVGSLGMGASLLSFEAVSDGPVSHTNIVGRVMGDRDSKLEAERILAEQKERALGVLGSNRDVLEALRDALILRDELVGDEIIGVIQEVLDRRASNEHGPVLDLRAREERLGQSVDPGATVLEVD
jgi:ATP-dependent Zn protease